MASQPGFWELIAGLALLIASARFMIWVNTSSDAGYLMIIGAFMTIGAYLTVVGSTGLVAGGLAGMAGNPARNSIRALGWVLGVLVATRLWNWRKPRKRRRPSTTIGEP